MATNHDKHHVMRFPLGLLASFITIIWLALLSAGLGLFHAPLIVMIGLACGALIFFKLRGNRTARFCELDGAAVILAVSFLFFTLPPGELILGGWDPGVYLHTGMEIVRTGALQFDHADLNSMAAPDQTLLMRNLHGIQEPFGGMRMLENGNISPQFYHAYPALLAVVMAFSGLWGGLLVNPLLHAGSILAFYGLVASVTKNRKWALMGALLLAANPTQIWMAKFCTAEMLTQFLLLSGLALLHYAHTRDFSHPLIFALGGSALGLAQLTRYDTLIFLTAFIPALLLTARPGDIKRFGPALGMMGLAIVHAWAHQRWIAPYYQPLGPSVTKGLIICAAATLALLAVKYYCRTNYTPTPAIRNLALLVVSIVWLGWMFFNWWLRPTLHMRTNASAKLEHVLSVLNLEFILPTLIGPTSRATLYLQSIFGIAGLSIALLGVVAWLWRRKDPVQQAWLWAGMGATLLLTWHPLNDLFMMWVSRRYVPVVIPWLIMAVILGGIWLSSITKKYQPLPIICRFSPMLVFISLLFVMPSSFFMARERDWPGLIAWFDEVQRSIPANAAIYTDQSGFAAPLRFIWGHRAYELQHPDEERRIAFYDLVDRASAREKTIYLLTSTTPPTGAFRHAQAVAVGEFPLATQIINHELINIPDAKRSRGGDFVLYKLMNDKTSKRQ